MMDRIETREQLQQLREACMAAARKETRKILVCAGTGCVSGGSLDIYAALKAKMEERNIPCEVELAMDPHDDVVGLKKSGCHGFCVLGPPGAHRAPGLAVYQGPPVRCGRDHRQRHRPR